MVKQVFCFMIFAIFVMYCEAAVHTVKVVDQENNPVNNAVVAFYSKSSSPTADTDDIAVMDQVNKQFLPSVIAIQKGQKVKFPNSDDIRHHVYSFSPTKPFEIKLYKGSNVAPILFDKPGIGILGCNIHDNMVGHIYVSDGEVTRVTNAEGEATFDEAVPERVAIWHKDLSIDGSLKVNVMLTEKGGTATANVELVSQAPPPSKRTFGSSRFGG
ncbi:methylamine utilization protein [Alteromonas hispanica]|uniref:Methylamine utilization protein n=1 Tax=Alteromonas hispanica TaxID=315421 RepID=A0A6L9MX24_9ALTE|nr:methylamine utilization protein [Alteromonas hispanica]NDW22748.1 methylamine utilization protein [Alteromonas hispanica]